MFINNTDFKKILFLLLIVTMNARAGIIDTEKNIFHGSELWLFNNNTMTAVVNTFSTTGAANSPSAPAGGTGLFRSDSLFGPSFNFLETAIGSPAGDQYGAATRTSTAAGSFSLFFPVLEMQWANNYYPLQAVTLNCNENTINEFVCFGEHSITAADSIDDASWLGTTFQWQLVGQSGGINGNTLSFFDASSSSLNSSVPSQIFTNPFQLGNEFRIVEGTIPSVPLPASIYLFLTGCLVLIGKVRIKKIH